MEEKATIGKLRIEQQEGTETISHSLTTRFHGVVHHVRPKISHGFMEGRALGSVCASTVGNKVPYPIKDLGHALLAAVALQEQPGDPQMCPMIP